MRIGYDWFPEWSAISCVVGARVGSASDNMMDQVLVAPKEKEEQRQIPTEEIG